MAVFLASIQAEWLKTKRSAAWWLVITGGILIPLILLAARFYNYELMSGENASPLVWQKMYSRAWNYMGSLLLPMGVILVTSLITQLEFRNNAWKQLHTAPLPYSTIFFSKLLVICTLLIVGFLLFNVGVFGMITIPALFITDVSYPEASFPLKNLLLSNGKFIIDILPIIALQFLLSLQFRNFLIPIGVGFGIYIASMISMNWQHGYIMPYIYSILEFSQKATIGNSGFDFHWLPLVYCLLFTLISFLLYRFKKDKA